MSNNLDFVHFWGRLPRLFPLGRLPLANWAIYLNGKGFLTPSRLNKRPREQIFRGLRPQKCTKSR